MLIHSPPSIGVFAGAKPPSPAVIFTCWKGECFVTSPKDSSASLVLLFALFNSYMCTCRKVSSSLCPNIAAVWSFLLIVQEDWGRGSLGSTFPYSISVV